MLSLDGSPVTIYDLASCLGNSYRNAMTPRNIQRSFYVTGIFPYSTDIFTDDEFLRTYVTDRKLAGTSTQIPVRISEESTSNAAESVPSTLAICESYRFYPEVSSRKKHHKKKR